jgi:hypothetical protein
MPSRQAQRRRFFSRAYITSPLTATQLASPDFPFQSILDTCLLVEERLSTRIANNKTHPYRAFFTTQTADIANKAEIPKTDSSSNPIVGVYGAVFDSSDSLNVKKCPRRTSRLRQEMLILGRGVRFTVIGLSEGACTTPAQTSR